jgi:hypothetical protein
MGNDERAMVNGCWCPAFEKLRRDQEARFCCTKQAAGAKPIHVF